MEYKKFDQGTWVFPKSRVPAIPTIGKNALTFGRSGRVHMSMRTAGSRHYTRSRYALKHAYQLCGVGANGSLVAPAYHCRTMLDPAIRLGAEVCLYPMHADLSPDLEGLKACLARVEKPVKALLATHYFGHQQNLDHLLSFCNYHDIALIEDCSHCLMVQPAQSTLGRLGRYSVWSPYKFFPSYDGGVLSANDGAAMPLDRPLPRGLLDELLGIFRVMEMGWSKDSLTSADTQDIDIDKFVHHHLGISYELEQAGSEPSAQYDRSIEESECLRSSRWIMEHTDVDSLIARRRENYRRWASSTLGLPNCRPLMPDLPDDCTPYMFPLYIDCPDVHFLALKCLGMTIWRWDDMAVSHCPISSKYRLKLLHLPCHQELSAIQMDWMTAAVIKVLTQVPRKLPT